MNKGQLLQLLGKNNKTENYNIIFTFETGDDTMYVVYTDNKKDEDGFIKPHAGIYQKENGKEKLLPIESFEEWAIIEKLLDNIESEQE